MVLVKSSGWKKMRMKDVRQYAGIFTGTRFVFMFKGI